MNQDFVLDGHVVKAGERRYIDLSLPPLYTHTSVTMPVHVVNGLREGPILFVIAALHGDEINGVEIIRRLLTKRVLKNIRGTLVAVPVINVYGFVAQSRYLPDRRDLNRSFPGSERGSMAARLADLVKSEIVDKCTHGIDLHTATAGRDNLPQVRYEFGVSAETSDMAHAFGAPVILNSEAADGTLRKACSDKPVILYEAGEALRFSEESITVGVAGIIRVMRYLAMLDDESSEYATALTEVESTARSLVCNDGIWMRAPQSGILRSNVELGDSVRLGDSLGTVADPFGESEEEVVSEVSGIIVGQSNLPLVHEGEAVFHVGCALSG